MYLGLIISSLIIGYSYADYNDDTIGYAGMASATNKMAADAAKEILLKGGNAADAAFAAQMVLNVVQPQSAGVGGGAFIMYYDAATKQVSALDAREEAPKAFNEYVFCDDVTCYETNGTSGDCDSCATIDGTERRTGGLSVGVPGTFYGFARLKQQFGSDDISWSELFDDAIDYAENGFDAYQGFVDGINGNIDGLSRFESTCKLLLNYPDCDESKYEVNDTVTNPDLAQTFMNLSAMDPDEAIEHFYTGAIAEAIVAKVKSANNTVTGRNGLMELEDLEQYRAVFREPVSSTITFDGEDYTFYGMPMPSSGPLTLQYQLKLNRLLQTEYNDVDDFKNDATSTQALHFINSIQNIAFADRNQYMADEDFVNVPVEGMLADSYIEERMADEFLRDMAQALPVDYGFPDGWNETWEQSPTTESGTAHINIVDKDGNVASITTTIESIYGSFVVLDGYGFFLNNELTDFSAPGIVNGIKVANAPEGGKKYRRTAIGDDASTMGGKRPRSSMSPTIVFRSDGTPYLTAGARGGFLIIGEVFRVLTANLQYGMNIQQAVNTPRVFGVNSFRLVESSWLEVNTNVTEKLVAKYGYAQNSLFERPLGRTGSCNAILIGDDNLLYCGADTSRWAAEGCAAVCSDDDSSCPFAMTTLPPDTTMATTKEVDDTCEDSNDYTWIIRFTFRITVNDDNIDVSSDSGRGIVRTACKRAFFRAIYEILMDWLDGFCFDLTDDKLTIDEYTASRRRLLATEYEIEAGFEYTSTSRRRLLTTEYEIEAGFEYNDDLQDLFFGNDSLYNSTEFGQAFGEELIELFIDANIIDETNITSIAIEITAPVEYVPEESDHKVEGALINATVIMGLIDVLVFLACLLYLVRNTYPRVQQEGDIDWKEARARYKLPYSIAFVEILGSLIHWIFAIIVIARYESYLGWILFCLLLAGEVVLYVRFILYKQLILYQIPKLKSEGKLTETELKDEIVARKTDVGILGLLLATVEDLPVVIIAIIVGENFGYTAGTDLALLMGIVSIIMKFGLLFGAQCGKTDDDLEKPGYVPSKRQEKPREKATKEAIELAEERPSNDNDEKKGLKSTNDVEEEEENKEEEDYAGGATKDDNTAKKEEEDGGDDEPTGNAEEDNEEDKPLKSDDDKEATDGNKDTEKEQDDGDKKKKTDEYVD